MASKSQVLSMYKSLLRESEKFSNYNFRAYALRRVRDSFKENKSLSDPKQVQKQYSFAQDNISLIRRQIAVGHMYSTDKLVIENTQ